MAYIQKKFQKMPTHHQGAALDLLGDQTLRPPAEFNGLLSLNGSLP